MMKMQVGGHNFDLNPKIKAYVDEKIGSLDHYLPKAAQQSQARVTLENDEDATSDSRFICEAIIRVPHATLQAREATQNIFAAVDIVEAKLKAQIHKYKDKHSPRASRGRLLFDKLMRKAD